VTEITQNNFATIVSPHPSICRLTLTHSLQAVVGLHCFRSWFFHLPAICRSIGADGQDGQPTETLHEAVGIDRDAAKPAKSQAVPSSGLLQGAG